MENPRDWGAWWAAVYGVTQSWKQLKWLSSSSSSSFCSLQDFIYKKIHIWSFRWPKYISSINLVFVSMIPGSQLSKPLEFPKPVESDKDVLYINEEIFGKQLRLGAPCQWSQPCDWKVGIFSPVSWPPGKRWKLKVEPVTDDLINHLSLMVSPSEPSRTGLGELLGCGHMEIWGEGDSKRAWKFTILSCLMSLPWVISFVINL